MGGAMDRRVFVRSLPVLAGAAALSVSACAGAAWINPRAVPGGLAVPASSVGPDGAFVALAGSDRPLYLSRDAEGAWTAVVARCTHRGCQPEPVGERLVCPCHGSEFSRSGRVLEGPAREDLRRVQVELAGNDLILRIPEVGA